MPVSRCRVSFTDTEGVEHVANVQATSVYEAVALAMREYADDSFVSAIPNDQTQLTVAVLPEPREHRIRLAQVAQWADKASCGPTEKLPRTRVRELLAYAVRH